MKRLAKGVFYFSCIWALELTMLHGRLWRPKEVPVLGTAALAAGVLLLCLSAVLLGKTIHGE